MKSVNPVHLTLLIMLFSLSTLVNASEQENCLSIIENHANIPALIDSGKYRYVKSVDKKSASHFNFSNENSYSEYINYAMSEIINKNPRANMPCPINSKTYQQLALQNNWTETPTVGQLVAPFELINKGSNKAIVLIHGLTDSPYSFHDLAQFFYQQGFTVRTLLLPGHGTAPSALLNVNYQQWQQATKYAIDKTAEDFDEVYLGGFSTGGALIFDYLMQQSVADKKIKGLMMWSPASKAKNSSAWLAQYVDYIPFVNWIDLDADLDFAKYESFPYNAAAQVHLLMSRIVGENAMNNRVMHDIPVFVVVSEHDQTIESKQTLVLIEEWQQAKNSQQNKNTTLVWYGDQAQIPSTLTDTINVISPSCELGQLCSDVYDIAHTATTNAPSNAHYGIESSYRNCSHYVTEVTKYLECKQSNKVINGELTVKNLKQHPLIQRLTYNPYYPEMLNSIQAFLRSVQ